MRAGRSLRNPDSGQTGAVFEVFRIFLLLGLTSFGGPTAHIGYFRTAFVTRKRWLDDRAFGELLAICQFLPGPASSQLGMGIGLHRAGLPGFVAAWLGFTLPSAVLMGLFAAGAPTIAAVLGSGWLVGLVAAAVAVVVHAVSGMARTFSPDRLGFAFAVLAFLCAVLVSNPFVPAAVIALAAAIGACVRNEQAPSTHASEPPAVASGSAPLRVTIRPGVAIAALAVFTALLAGLPVLASVSGSAMLSGIDATYRAGALVFGGGHTVLPALEAAFLDSGTVSSSDFFAGYGAAQAMPGPLFTFASYLGASGAISPGGTLTAILATVAIFLPGALLLIGVLPFWARVRDIAAVHRALRGVNAAVVGLLASALYSAIGSSWFPHGTPDPLAIAISMLALAGIVSRRIPPWAVVLASGIVGAAADAVLRVLQR